MKRECVRSTSPGARQVVWQALGAPVAAVDLPVVAMLWTAKLIALRLRPRQDGDGYHHGVSLT